MKKTHLVTQPTRIEDINFDDFDDGLDTRWSHRIEQFRVKSNRRIRHQEA